MEENSIGSLMINAIYNGLLDLTRILPMDNGIPIPALGAEPGPDLACYLEFILHKIHFLSKDFSFYEKNLLNKMVA